MSDVSMNVTLVRPDGSTSVLVPNVADEPEAASVTVLVREAGSYALVLSVLKD